MWLSFPGQAASVLENSGKGCKYFINWRNAAINGTRLSIEGVQRLRDYTIPTSGALRLDYVTYRVGIRMGGGDLRSNIYASMQQPPGTM